MQSCARPTRQDPPAQPEAVVTVCLTRPRRCHLSWTWWCVRPVQPAHSQLARRRAVLMAGGPALLSSADLSHEALGAHSVSPLDLERVPPAPLDRAVVSLHTACCGRGWTGWPPLCTARHASIEPMFEIIVATDIWYGRTFAAGYGRRSWQILPAAQQSFQFPMLILWDLVGTGCGCRS